MGMVKAGKLDILDPANSAAYRDIRTFAESKGSHAQPMSVFYNRFTGWKSGEGATQWGLTRRMVDIYLLALCQAGVIRINRKRGGSIDSTMIASIEFKPDVLRDFESVELPKALSQWEKVAPFIEVIAGLAPGSITGKYEPRQARDGLSKVTSAWLEANKVDSLLERVAALFGGLKQKDPYDDILGFWMEFFQHRLPGDSDENNFNAFMEALLTSLPLDKPEDLSTSHLATFRERWKALQALLLHFDDLAALFSSAGSYASTPMPLGPGTNALHQAIARLRPLIQEAKELVINPDRTHAELTPVLDAVWGGNMTDCSSTNSENCALRQTSFNTHARR